MLWMCVSFGALLLEFGSAVPEAEEAAGFGIFVFHDG